jgi:hypothetical protein
MRWEGLGPFGANAQKGMDGIGRESMWMEGTEKEGKVINGSERKVKGSEENRREGWKGKGMKGNEREGNGINKGKHYEEKGIDGKEKKRNVFKTLNCIYFPCFPIVKIRKHSCFIQVAISLYSSHLKKPDFS